MPLKTKRSTDKGILKFSTPLHVGSGIFIGYMIKTYFPNANAIQIADMTLDWLINIIENLGGLVALTSTGVLIFQIYKYIKEKNN